MQSFEKALTFVRRPYRATGRFPALRHAYSWLQAHRAGPGTRAGEATAVGDESLFPGLSPAAAARELCSTGFHLGWTLPSVLVDEIRDFAEAAACSAPGIEGDFRYGDVEFGMLDGQPVAVADVRNAGRCAAVNAIWQDPKLTAAAAAYLGYVSKRGEVRLFWSFAAPLPAGVRRSLGQTVDLHYDVPWFNSVYTYFYLTPTDRLSGAHVLVPNSAGTMPLGFRLSSCYPDRNAIYARYGSNCEFIVEGDAGFGFMTDPFGLHKALPPVTRDRLMLQFRFL